MNLEIVMYIIVNKEIKMSPGKLAAQCAHSAVKAYEKGLLLAPENTKVWRNGSYTKIILKASEYEMTEIMNEFPMFTVYTKDEGRTEIPKNSLTTIALIPMLKNDAPSVIKTLKLL